VNVIYTTYHLDVLVESAFERTARLLLNEPQRRWTGLELSKRTGFSRAMTSRILTQLGEDAVVAKPYKNQFVLVEPIRLLMLWSCKRRMPQPTHVRTSKTDQEIDAIVRKAHGVAVTLFRGAWLRTHYMRTTSYELYASKRAVTEIVREIGRASADPQRVSIYADETDAALQMIEKVDGIPIVSVPQNIVDLMSVGGSGPRVALQLGNVSGLLKV
jgi:hypothetical protein